MLASLRQAWTEIAKDEGDQDYFFRTVLDDIEKFRAKAASRAGAGRAKRLGRAECLGRDESHALNRAVYCAVLRLQIGDDVGPLAGVRDTRESERHRRIRDHRLWIGDPFVDVLLGPDEAARRRASSCRPSTGCIVGHARGFPSDDAVELRSDQGLGAGPTWWQMPHLAKAALPLVASPSASAGAMHNKQRKRSKSNKLKLLISILLRSSLRDLQRSVRTIAQRSPLVLLLSRDCSRTPQTPQKRRLRHRNSEQAQGLPCTAPFQRPSGCIARQPLSMRKTRALVSLKTLLRTRSEPLMSHIALPSPDLAILAAPERHPEAAEEACSRRDPDRRPGRAPHLRDRRAHRLSLPAARRRAAGESPRR